MGLCLLEMNEYDSAMVHFNRTLEIANQYKDSLGSVTMDKIYGVEYGNMARVFMAQNKLTAAERLALQSIALNDREGYEVEFAQSVKLQLAKIYASQKDFESMFNVLKGMSARIQTGNPNHRLDWNRLMATYYQQTSQPDKAVVFYKAFTTLSDSIDISQKLLAAADVNRRLRDKEQQLEIATLKKENEVAVAYMWLALLFTFMTLVIIYLVYKNYRRNKKHLLVLRDLHNQIKAQKAAREREQKERHKLITEAVIRAQEEERSIIGLELHDNINQVLTTVKLHNEMVLEGIGDAQQILPRTMQYLQSCINEIRSLSRRLSAPTLGKISLEESVKDLIDSINATSKVKIEHQISGINANGVKKEIHLGVYRILQEQLNNVLKHADASEVHINLEQDDIAIRLCVTDNGKGFSAGSQKVGIGLMNMQTRVESLNGTFELDSQPGGGCTVQVVLPCLSREC
jgi:signal transduction histidine kinase